MLMDEFSLKDKVAIVTGAGRVSAKLSASPSPRRGRTSSLFPVLKMKSIRPAARSKSSGREAIAIPADVTRWEDVKAMADKAYARFKHIDILVNNAGTAAFSPSSAQPATA